MMSQTTRVLHAVCLSPRADWGPSDLQQITCLYDMDIPRPNNFNETYLYEGTPAAPRRQPALHQPFKSQNVPVLRVETTC